MEKAKKISSPGDDIQKMSRITITQDSPLRSLGIPPKENLENADEELIGEKGGEKKNRREVIPSIFSNSRNLQDIGLQLYYSKPTIDSHQTYTDHPHTTMTTSIP